MQGAAAADAPPHPAGAAAAAPAPPIAIPDYTRPGPLQPTRLPRLEHCCAKCFPACQINGCLLRVDVWYPKGGAAFGLAPTYPLAIFSGGFLVNSGAYVSYAKMLASWGYTVMLYDKVESALSTVNDLVSVRLVSVRSPRLSFLCARHRARPLAPCVSDTQVRDVARTDLTALCHTQSRDRLNATTVAPQAPRACRQ